jgi:hypothetical protein
MYNKFYFRRIEMQIRCSNCHRPYALSKNEVEAALDQLEQEHLGHYNSSCPHCRKVNRVSHDELLRAAPDRARHAKEEQETPGENVAQEETE